MRAGARFVLQTARCYGSDRATSFAAAIAYYTLFSIFPFAVFLIGIGGYFLDDDQRGQLISRLTSALGGASTANVAQQVNAAGHGRADLGIIGLVGALWSASAVFAAIRTGLSVVWKQKRQRPWWRQKLADQIGVFGLTLVLALSFAATAGITFVEALTTRLFGHSAGASVTLLFGLVLTLLPLGIVYLAFSLLFIWASPPEISWRHVWPGAVLGAAGFVLLSFFFGLYARSLGHYATVYGSLGAVVAFLFYAYLIGSLILFGAEVTEQYARVLRAHAVPESAACDVADEPVVARPARPEDARMNEARTVPRPGGSRATGMLVLKPSNGTEAAEDAISAGELFPER